MVFGVPGSGKSYNEKSEMGQVLCFTKDDIIVVDPMGEYKDIAAAWGGQYINLTQSAENVFYVNPFHVPDVVPDIDRFVAEHEAWIAAQLARQAQRLTQHPPRSPEEQEALRQKARQTLPPLVHFWARQMGVTPTGVKITAARSRFGSCSGKNSLCFSLYLMEYPEEAAEAVVVHELAHIRHKNHGPDFYALVRGTLPDYDARIKLLK